MSRPTSPWTHVSDKGWMLNNLLHMGRFRRHELLTLLGRESGLLRGAGVVLCSRLLILVAPLVCREQIVER